MPVWRGTNVVNKAEFGWPWVVRIDPEIDPDNTDDIYTEALVEEIVDKRMKSLLNPKDTFKEAIDVLIELRTDIFNQITQMEARKGTVNLFLMGLNQ